jgi:hypothetical protein
MTRCTHHLPPIPRTSFCLRYFKSIAARVRGLFGQPGSLDQRAPASAAESSEPTLAAVLIPARPQIPNQILLSVKLSINSEASFAFVFLDVFDNLNDICSTESWAQRQLWCAPPNGQHFRRKFEFGFLFAGHR